MSPRANKKSGSSFKKHDLNKVKQVTGCTWNDVLAAMHHKTSHSTLRIMLDNIKNARPPEKGLSREVMKALTESIHHSKASTCEGFPYGDEYLSRVTSCVERALDRHHRPKSDILTLADMKFAQGEFKRLWPKQ